MISLEDCIDFSSLTEEQVLAIAEHEHVPEIAAAGLAIYLKYRDYGTESIRNMIVDDIRAGQARNDKRHVQTLLHVLHHFLRNHPEVQPEQHPWSASLRACPSTGPRALETIESAVPEAVNRMKLYRCADIPRHRS